MSSIVIHSKSSYYPTGFRSKFIFFFDEKLIFQRLVAKKLTAPLLRIFSDVLIAVENYQRHNYMNVKYSVYWAWSLSEKSKMASMKTSPSLVNFFIYNSTFGPKEGMVCSVFCFVPYRYLHSGVHRSWKANYTLFNLSRVPVIMSSYNSRVQVISSFVNFWIFLGFK